MQLSHHSPITTNMSKFKGTVKICLWFREYHLLETGPPVPNYFLQATSSANEILGSGYTDMDGCFSTKFESSWPGNILTIGIKRHNGHISRHIYPSDSDQIVDFEDLSIDWLPEKYFQPHFDCSTCSSYFSGSSFESLDESGSKPLTEHSCSNNQWGLNCCGYDWNSNRCGVQEFFPTFSFLHECGGCEALETKDFSNYGPGFKESDPPPPVDCSESEYYYPEASMETPKNERGDLSPLSNHACMYEGQNNTYYGQSRFGSSCCAYDYDTLQCGLWDYSMGDDYLNEGMFLYPCSLSESSNTSSLNVGAIVGGVVAGFAVILGLVYVYMRQRRQKNDHDPTSTEPPNIPSNEQDIEFNAPPKMASLAVPVQTDDYVIPVATSVAPNDQSSVDAVAVVMTEPSAPPREEMMVSSSVPLKENSKVVRTVPPTILRTTNGRKSVAKRLEELESVKGLLTKDEYDDKKNEILASL